MSGNMVMDALMENMLHAPEEHISASFKEELKGLSGLDYDEMRKRLAAMAGSALKSGRISRNAYEAMGIAVHLSMLPDFVGAVVVHHIITEADAIQMDGGSSRIH